ncbi:uncharacterized protein LOC113141689 isoform X2 [Mastacembelus armatus]|uniref:uncharacterized protein LOC113141689 isoform X2 n=1 Tax=Mastacembelus armatus TaxID=205130 RepID=UPI000E460467|nr:uncharacterized protein LOC113141689 isoform X2 [Mastacembelus armatus]
MCIHFLFHVSESGFITLSLSLLSLSKMSLDMWLTAIITSISICKTLECDLRNTSCNKIKSHNGFRFLLECHGGVEISVYNSEQRVIANAVRQDFNFSSDVISMDQYSVVTRKCKDLSIQCIFLNGRYVTENCLDYKITDDPKEVPPPYILIIGVLCGVILLIGILGMSYMFWKKKLKQHEGNGVQVIPMDDVEPQTDQNHAAVIGLPPGSGQHGSGENNINEQPNTLEAVHVHSGDISGAHVSGAFHHLATNRNLRDDLEVNSNKGETGKDIVREMYNAHTPCDSDREDHETEQLWLLIQGTAIPAFDMTGEAEALVNKDGFDHVSRCSTAPNGDVKSTTKMKNQYINTKQQQQQQ